MSNKKRFSRFLVISAVFFCAVALTGFFQISVIKKNMETLLKKEAEIAYRHLAREIDINLEYLELARTSPLIITPGILSAMAYEDLVIEDLIERITNRGLSAQEQIPLSNYIIFDKKGNILEKKGTYPFPKTFFGLSRSEKEKIIKKKGLAGKSDLLLSIHLDDKIIVCALTEEDLKELKKKYILRELSERESEKLKLAGINIFAPDGKPYYVSPRASGDYFRFRSKMDTKHFPGYDMEILLSKEPVDEVLKKTILYLLFTLIALFGFSLLVGWMIFLAEKKIVQFEREMAKKERLLSLGMLSSNMAHEIRNPLNAISLSLERLKRDFFPTDSRRTEYEKFLEVAGLEIRRINRIVEDFLFLSKPDYPNEQINLKNLIDEIFIVLKEKGRIKEVDLINRIDQRISILGQKEKLKQAFFNLILNGIEAIEKKGQLKVQAKESEKEVMISIEDTGCGIPKEEIERIFEYHYTSKDRGLGLGLPISYMIVKDHGGRIEVESEKGKGTIVRVYIPMERKNYD